MKIVDVFNCYLLVFIILKYNCFSQYQPFFKLWCLFVFFCIFTEPYYDVAPYLFLLPIHFLRYKLIYFFSVLSDAILTLLIIIFLSGLKVLELMDIINICCYCCLIFLFVLIFFDNGQSHQFNAAFSTSLVMSYLCWRQSFCSYTIFLNNF